MFIICRITKKIFKYNGFKKVILTSIFWILIYSFVLIYCLNENNSKSIEPTFKIKPALNAFVSNHSVSDNKNDLYIKQLRLIKLKNIITKSAHKAIELFKDTYLFNSFNPVDWPGENGNAVTIPENKRQESEKRFKENNFNIFASDLIALNRKIPDIRSKTCINNEYTVDLPKTSIIIVYHNEGNSTLLRGLISIVERSPLRYIKEIILVDDASENRKYLHEPLDAFVKTLPIPVKILRNKERLGLIRSRLRGADTATGEILTFLDAHIEASPGWLVPLLNEIKKDRKTVPCPIIDIIDHKNFKYLEGSSRSVGGFSKDFVFTWDLLSNEERSLPIRSPMMAGGLFSIERNYFYELGAYDNGMNIWGAENLEMSLRIWMCGGTLLILPCSHVGHIFRESSPYSFPGGVIDVWTDEYANYFYNKMPHLKNYQMGNIQDRIDLRKNLKCKSFKWFLENIYPQAPIPIDYIHVGYIKNKDLNFCINGGRSDPGVLICEPLGSNNQIIEYSKSKKLIYNNQCLYLDNTNKVIFSTCNDDFNSKWNYNETLNMFIHEKTSYCLSFNNESKNLIVDSCSLDDMFQKWIFSNPILPQKIK